MSIHYEVLPTDNISCIRDLCNELMAYQKAQAYIHPELFDNMNFETRMLPAVCSAKENYILVAKSDNEPIGYAYSNILPKDAYSTGFATLNFASFFDLNSVKVADVGCLSQFFIKDTYRNQHIGSVLFKMSLDWLNSFQSIHDIFIFVSNGNSNALKFYLAKGFNVSHQLGDGFITVLRNL